VTRDKYKIYGEVFDDFTLNTLYRLADKGYFEVLEGVIAAGKEANVFRVKKGDSYFAAKIYMTLTSDFKNMWQYIRGDPRFSHVGKSKHQLVFAWAKKEFKNLMICEKLGVRVPHPIVQMKNVLIMEFIGENGKAAPIMKMLKPYDPEKWYGILMGWIEKLYKNGFVHGDINEFNVLNAGEPVLIDVAQGVKIEHPMAEMMHDRDVENLKKWFSKLGVKVD
jgi:RIO kinase 1